MIPSNCRVAAYARFSSSSQREESIFAQLRAISEHCKRNNYTIVRTYIDEAKSATSTLNRNEFMRMIADSKKGDFDIVLVHKLDRFARNRYDSAIYQRELKKNGVKLYSVLENLDDSPESVIMQSVLEGFAEYYSKNLGREVKKGMLENALSCRTTGGCLPLGYDLDSEGHYIINEKEAEIVRLIYSMAAKGSGYRAILDELHNRNMLTKKLQPFKKTSLYSILTNPKYQGCFIYNRHSSKAADGTRNNHSYKDYSDMVVIEGGIPRIIDDETFNAVKKRIQENKHEGGGRCQQKENYLLTGRVFCNDCGKSMCGNMRYSGRNKAKYVTYRCQTHKKQCGNKEINRDYLEAYTIYLLETHIFNSRALAKIKNDILSLSSENNFSAEKDFADIDATIARNAEELKNVADAVAAGLLSSTLIDRLNVLEEEKQKLAEKKAKLASLTKTTDVNVNTALILSEYNALSKAPSNPEYKTFIKQFIDRIVVGRYTVTFTLKTGLDIYNELDTTFTIRREEIYNFRNEKKTTTA